MENEKLNESIINAANKTVNKIDYNNLKVKVNFNVARFKEEILKIMKTMDINKFVQLDMNFDDK